MDSPITYGLLFFAAFNKDARQMALEAVKEAYSAHNKLAAALLAKADAPGSLAVAGTATAGCAASEAAAFTPDGKFVFQVGAVPASVCGYAVDPASGAMIPVPRSPVLVGLEPDGLAIEPAGQYLYVPSLTLGQVSGFVINGNDGSLTPVPGSPFVAGTFAQIVMADPLGRFVYVLNNNYPSTAMSTISAYRMDRTTGSLTPVPGSPFATDPGAMALAIDPTGRYVYSGGGGISAFAIDQNSGALSFTGARIGSGAPVDNPGGIAVDPTGRFLYASSFFGNTLSAYRIGVTGALTAIGTPLPVGAGPRVVSVFPNGRFVYVANSNATTISAFAIDLGTGALTEIAGSPFDQGVRPGALATWGTLPADSAASTGAPYSANLRASGGVPPYAFTIASGALPSGLALDPVTGMVTGTPTAAGAATFTAQVRDATGQADTKSYTIDVEGGAGGNPASTVVEFYNASLDHYFITWVLDEIAKLDAGTQIRGWARTGQSFNTYATPQPGTSPVCRFYIPPGLGDSHFFGRGTQECDATAAKNPSFVNEDPDFMNMFLPAAGVCPAGTVRIYRVFSNRPDANHRYMTDPAIRTTMVGRGWLAEGDGPDLVVMCAPG